MLKVEYGGQEYDALGIYNTGSGDGTIAILVGVRLFLSGAGSYSDPIPVGEVTVLNGGTSSGAGVGSLNALTGDITLAAGSNVTLTPSGNTITIAAAAGTPGSNTVTTAMIQNNAITTGKIADGAVTPIKIQPGAINTYLNTDASGVVGWVTLPSSGGVTSFNGRTGVVSPQSNDYTAAMVGAIDEDLLGTANGVAPLDNASKVPYFNLPVGTGANTIARGDDPRFGTTSFISRSAATPSSPNAGDVWYKYLDSGFTEFDEAFTYVTAAGANAWRSIDKKVWRYTASGSVASPPPGAYMNPPSGKSWFSSFEATVNVAGTNNGSNYWTITLSSLNAAGSTVQTLATFNTSAIAAGSWVGLGGLIGGGNGLVVDTGGTERLILVSASATGAPGSLFFGATAFYRRQLG